MNLPLLSVLMPVYNGERFLQPALDSIFSQSFRDFEFIVIDDGSTDATAQMLDGCDDPRLKVFHLPHAGLVPALNEGLTRCSGAYVVRMDADDISYTDRLAHQLEYLQSHSECDVVTCWSDLLDDQGKVVGRMTGGVSEDMVLELAGGNDIVHGSIMLRGSALPPAPVYAAPPEDFWLWVRLARGGKGFHCLEEPLYGFREHTNRYSLVRAESQSRGIVEVQWPLLEECARTRNLQDAHTRSRLVLGWGRVGGAAYRSGQSHRGLEAYRRFRELARGAHDGQLDDTILSGAESFVWGGCPFSQRLALRLMELRMRPGHFSSYRNLLLCFSFVRAIRQAFKQK